MTSALKRSLSTPSGRIRNQQEFLARIREPFKKAAKNVFKTNFVKEQRALVKLEREMLEIIKQNPGALTKAVRARAIKILDEAYEIGEAFDTASRRIWKEVYKDPGARATVDNARANKVISFGKNKPNWARNGNAPRMKTRVKGELPVPLELDHWPPRERNPFKSFDGEALEPITKKANVSFRREFAAKSAFPMGSELRGSGKDIIEEFVQQHSLSRSQRPEGTTPEGTRGRNIKSFARPATHSSKATGGKENAGKGTNSPIDGSPDPKPSSTPDAKRVKTNASGFTRSGKRALAKSLGKAVDVVSVDAVDLVTRPLNLGFISGLIVALTVQIMLYVLEKKLAEVNAVGIGREYRDKVYKAIRDKASGMTLEELTNATVRRIQTDWGDFEGIDKKTLKKYIYADYQYDVWMDLQANDPSDVVVFFLKGFNFAEVYSDVRPVGNVSAVPRSSPLSERAIMKQKRKMFKGDNKVRYRYTHKMLMYDPVVYQRYIDVWNWHIKCRREYRDKLKRMSGKDKVLYDIHGKNAVTLIKEFKFREAVHYLDGQHEWLTYLGEPDARAKRHLFGLKQLAKAGDQVIRKARNLQADRRSLFLMFVGRDIIKDRKKADRKLRKLKREALKKKQQERKRDWRAAPGVGGRMW